MATAREIKKRIRSVKNIAQTTRAMEAVSASRVRRAQARVLASRAFADKAWEILLDVQKSAKGTVPHRLLTARPEVKKIMILLITSDRGLAGAFNINIIRVAQRFAARLGKPAEYVTVGRKGRDSMIRFGEPVIAEFSDLPPDPTTIDIGPATRLAIDEFLSGKVDEVFIAYTDFINMLTQHPAVKRWLPLTPKSMEDQVAADLLKPVPEVSSGTGTYEYEPGADAILNDIVPRFTELQLYQALLESQASEHAARMVAMRNASDNAAQLTAEYTLLYNKARQAAITAEILDIVGGANALQQAIEILADQILAAADAVSVTPASTPAVKKAPAKTHAEQRDDLTKIEGIGKKIAAALVEAGIDTFEKLSGATTEELEAALKAAGVRLAPSLATWAEQASYAAKGDWDALQKMQDQLVAGRRVR
jgi:F-type H+-transporting ATPase subunit gamma